jgi:hypothetical protein
MLAGIKARAHVYEADAHLPGEGTGISHPLLQIADDMWNHIALHSDKLYVEKFVSEHVIIFLTTSFFIF